MVYSVEITDTADAEADAIADWLALNVTPDYAARWYEALIVAIGDLATMPRKHAIAPENDLYDVEIRRLLFYGPSRRRGGTVYRILFHIIEPADGSLDGVVRVLHIRHGSLPLPGRDADPR